MASNHYTCRQYMLKNSYLKKLTTFMPGSWWCFMSSSALKITRRMWYKTLIDYNYANICTIILFPLIYLLPPVGVRLIIIPHMMMSLPWGRENFKLCAVQTIKFNTFMMLNGIWIICQGRNAVYQILSTRLPVNSNHKTQTQVSYFLRQSVQIPRRPLAKSYA